MSKIERFQHYILMQKHKTDSDRIFCKNQTLDSILKGLLEEGRQQIDIQLENYLQR